MVWNRPLIRIYYIGFPSRIRMFPGEIRYIYIYIYLYIYIYMYICIYIYVANTAWCLATLRPNDIFLKTDAQVQCLERFCHSRQLSYHHFTILWVCFESVWHMLDQHFQEKSKTIWNRPFTNGFWMPSPFRIQPNIPNYINLR